MISKKENTPFGIRSTVAVALAVALTALGIGLLLLVLAHLLPSPRHDAAFFGQFAGMANFINPIPLNRVGFQLSCLAAPLLILLTLRLGWGIAGRLPERWLNPEGERRTACLLALGIAAVFLLCVGRLFYFPSRAAFDAATQGLVQAVAKHLSWKALLGLLLAGGALAAFLAAARRQAAWTGRATGALLLLAWAFSCTVKLFSTGDVADTYPFMVHFNALAHSAVEAANGRHWLVDFPNQYGGYAEFLGLLLRHLPRQVESLSLTFLSLHAAALLFLLVLARALIVDNALCLLTGLALLFCGNIQLLLFGGADYIFQFFALRAFFPSLALCAAFFYFRAPAPGRYLLVSALAGVASVWNLESGLILWASWVGGAAFLPLCRRNWRGAARHLAVQFLFPAAAWGLLALCLHSGGGRPDWRQLTAYQGIFYAGGLGNLPLAAPDLWMLPIGIYLVAMARAGMAFYRRKADGRDGFSVMLTLFGIGIFTYFENRAALANLAFVSYPALLLFAGWADARLRRSGGGWELGWYVPGLAVLLGLAAAFTAALPVVAQRLGQEGRILRHHETTPFQADAAFIQAHTAPGEPCFLLSRQSGLLHYLSATPGLLPLASPEEWLTTAQFRSVFAALRDRELPKVFLDEDFFFLSPIRPELLQELRDTLAASYRAEAASPNGRVMLYLPRD